LITDIHSPDSICVADRLPQEEDTLIDIPQVAQNANQNINSKIYEYNSLEETGEGIKKIGIS